MERRRLVAGAPSPPAGRVASSASHSKDSRRLRPAALKALGAAVQASLKRLSAAGDRRIGALGLAAFVCGRHGARSRIGRPAMEQAVPLLRELVRGRGARGSSRGCPRGFFGASVLTSAIAAAALGSSCPGPSVVAPPPRVGYDAGESPDSIVGALMPRIFNTAGPCLPGKHYLLDPCRRLPGVTDLIVGEFYFVLHAPRQTGKTTLLRTLSASLTSSGTYAALTVSLESFTSDDVAQRA